MLKEKMKLMGGLLVKNSKMVFPIVLVLAVAITVLVALNAKDSKRQEELAKESTTQESIGVAEPTAVPSTEVLLAENTIPEIQQLIDTYYSAYADGDIEVIKSISNQLDETEGLRIQAMSEYVEAYPVKTIYTKPGPLQNSYLTYVHYKMKVKNYEDTVSGMETFYVCMSSDGSYYLNEGEVSDEELEFIEKVASQEDVVELYNRVNVECSDTLKENEELFYYIQEVVKEVQKSTGEALAEQIQNTSSTEGTEMTEPQGDGTENADGEAAEPAEPIQNAEPVYAKATTTVNVRVSDSEQSDKVDKVSGGTKVEVLEQKVNGWSKVKVGKTEGYIKSEFLQLINTATGMEVIGTVAASSNVNVRVSASESADRLGVLSGGEVVDLLGRENGWCKINYNGQIGYVKEDFVQ
ncbi:MAG: SH3 domain-containing protein [Lachnospiraceae bacterium]|nr:SH3 domain-containing protein [Lachnospiraceae bacterium]